MIRAAAAEVAAKANKLQGIDGIFALNKPPGISCTGLLDYLKKNAGLGSAATPFSEHFEKEQKLRLSGKKIRRSRPAPGLRVGHGGTLDVEAGGLLVIGLGKSCKLLDGFLKGGKSYLADARLGVATDTYDAEGRVTQIAQTEGIGADDITRCLQRFSGNIEQLPPMYSAIRVDGRRLYEYARMGQDVPVPLKPRPVYVDNINLVYFSNPGQQPFGARVALPSDAAEYYASGAHRWVDGAGSPGIGDVLLPYSNDPRAARVQLAIRSGGGVYIRSLIHDLGQTLGSAATMLTLLRLSQGPLRLDRDSIDVSDLPYIDRIVAAIEHVKNVSDC
ncbi:TruB pseudouridine (psi) synthase 1 [Coemansia sp. RSA 2599]|nr:TruB pseudouridine (psi) synthase 1 [Coemansia sp. RSA 2598]KAJ1824886.1 TruB pseudouridine (psi) synthase 1 [Coemansia sp. RSA 2599]